MIEKMMEEYFEDKLISQKELTEEARLVMGFPPKPKKDPTVWVETKGKMMPEKCLKNLNPSSWLGKKMTDEHRKKISEGNIGRVVSDETRKKISERQCCG